jgi:hypothetical protein
MMELDVLEIKRQGLLGYYDGPLLMYYETIDGSEFLMEVESSIATNRLYGLAVQLPPNNSIRAVVGMPPTLGDSPIRIINYFDKEGYVCAASSSHLVLLQKVSHEESIQIRHKILDRRFY